MSQNDLSIANQGFPAFRSDLNAALQALGSTNSGTSAPSTTYANQLWYDTTNNILYIRNEDNDAWIKLFTLDQTNDNVESLHADTIAEATSGSGVTIDSVLLKDGELGSTSSAVPINSSSLNGGQFGGRRNIIYNGAMNIATRSSSEAGKGDASGYFTCDRWRIHVGGTATAGRFTMSKVTDVHDGFGSALKLDCTTADTSIAAGEQLQLQQRFEGQDLQQLKKGTSDAEKVTVSFYVKGNASATYVCELEDVDNSRNNTQAFSVTTDWTRVVLTFDGDTTGALDNDVNRSFNVNFWLHGGSTYSSGTFASNTWASITNANRYAGSRTSFFDSTDRTFFITGVQMEVGSVTPFEHRSFGEEKKLCQRYYFQTESQNFAGVASSAARLICGYRIPDMRATPTYTFISFNGTESRLSRATNNADTTFSNVSVQSLNGFFQIISASTFIAGEGYFAQLKADSEI